MAALPKTTATTERKALKVLMCHLDKLNVEIVSGMNIRSSIQAVVINKMYINTID